MLLSNIENIKFMELTGNEMQWSRALGWNTNWYIPINTTINISVNWFIPISTNWVDFDNWSENKELDIETTNESLVSSNRLSLLLFGSKEEKMKELNEKMRKLELLCIDQSVRNKSKKNLKKSTYVLYVDFFINIICLLVVFESLNLA